MSNSVAIDRWLEANRQTRRPAKEVREFASLRGLLWTYFALLFLEGVLRKWVAPSLATPLLFIRDPIAILIVVIAVRDGALKRSIGFYVGAAIGLSCLIAGLVVLPSKPQVPLYGFRCDFLHLPLIAIIPSVFTRQDIDKLMRVVLYLALPIALLMAWQFHSPNSSWINSGLDNSFTQIDSAQGHIRPPGPFSFVVGPVCYCSVLAAALMGASVDRRKVPKALFLCGAAGLVIAALFSASRGLVASVAIVLATGMVGALAGNPKIFGRYVGIILGVGMVAVVIGSSSMLQDTVSVFSSRVDAASQNEGGVSGLVDRFFGDYAKVVPAMVTAQTAGSGLGMGTTGGAQVLAGTTHEFLLAEGEWPRNVFESGPVLGLMFILFRAALVAWCGWFSFLAVRRGQVLAACLFGACGADLLGGQFGQSTVVGFTVFGAGLCLAACKRDEPTTDSPASAETYVPPSSAEALPA